MFLRYIKRKLERRKARRVFQEYPFEIITFKLPGEGEAQFAYWKNPLNAPVTINHEMVDFFRQFIPKGSLAIDIGANTGDTTVPMALAAGKEGLVIGFDPNPHVFKILETNVSLNPDKTNIVALPFAITEKDDEFYYASSEASFGNGGISSQPSRFHGSFTLPEKIKGIKLEPYLEQQYREWLPKISCIKVDAEGYDKQIIKSIHQLIEKYKPVIIAECFSNLSRSEREELYNCVAEKGYELFYFADFIKGTEVQPLAITDMLKRKHFNFYAIPVK